MGGNGGRNKGEGERRRTKGGSIPIKVIETNKKNWKCMYMFAYIMEYYSAIIKDKILSFAAKWIQPENTKLNKISQSQEDKCFLLCGR